MYIEAVKQAHTVHWVVNLGLSYTITHFADETFYQKCNRFKYDDDGGSERLFNKLLLFLSINVGFGTSIMIKMSILVLWNVDCITIT